MDARFRCPHDDRAANRLELEGWRLDGVGCSSIVIEELPFCRPDGSCQRAGLGLLM